MQSFLAQVAEVVLKIPSHDWAEVCIVLPNRRAGLFFKRELASHLKKPAFLPAIQSLPDFIAACYPSWTLPDRITLLFELYKAYTEHLPGESFQQFHPWGEMLLSDLEELDKNSVAPSRLFLNLKQAKAMEGSLGFSAAELESFREFWLAFSNQPLKKTQTAFLALWEKIPLIVSSFQDRLLLQHYTYEGKLQAMLASDVLASENPTSLWPYKHIVFGGLHALTKAEKVLIETLQKANTTTVLWDADSYYTALIPEHEAGSFLRQYSPAAGFPSQLGKSRLQIEAIGVPSGMGQARVAGTLLHQLGQAANGSLENVAVILPDEDLLLPLLYSLPPSLGAFNVTMGYPLAGSTLHALVRTLASLYKRSRASAGGGLEYYHEDVLRICTHPYLQEAYQTKFSSILKKIQQGGFSYWPANELNALLVDTPLVAVFSSMPTAASAFSAFQNLLRALLIENAEPESLPKLDGEILAHGTTQLQRLYEATLAYQHELSLDALWQLIEQVVRSSRVSFTGEPLAGLQIMGYLETRALSFDTLIVLSCNEGTLPPRGHRHSFIPYALRKSYGLPTVDDADAVNAYHFYRLLQRAKKVILLYDSISEGDGATEKSRYLHQLEIELAAMFPDTITYSEREVTTTIAAFKQAPISVPKTGDVAVALSRFVATNGVPVESLSPTDIQTYVACPLRFYFHKIAKLREADELIEGLDERLFGLVLHSALEALYKPMVGKTVTAEEITRLASEVPLFIRRAAKQNVSGLNAELTGKALLLVRVMEKLIDKLLKLDEEHAPFTLLHIEERLHFAIPLSNDRKVLLAGRVDRIDEKEGKVRVLDYKTGNIETPKVNNLREVFTDPDKKYILQGLLYSLMLNTTMPVEVGILPMRSIMIKGIVNPLEKIDLLQMHEQSLSHLQTLVAEMLDEKIPFIPKKSEENCNYCPYYRMCYFS